MTGQSTLRSILVVSFAFLTCLAALAQPVIGIAKTANVTGMSVSFDLYLENLGTEDLHQVAIHEDLDAVFGAGNWSLDAPPSLISDPGTLVLNALFDGSTDSEILDTSSTLIAGATAQIRVDVTATALVNLGSGLGVHSNQVTASALSPVNAVTSDASDDGIASDSDEDGNPNEDGENDATSFTLELARIGLAKRMLYGGLSGGNPIVKIRYRVINYGNQTLTGLAITEDFNGVFGSGNYTHLVDPNQLNGEGSLNYNASFNGNSNTALLNGGSTLNPEEDITFEVWERVNVISDQGFGSGIYHNQVTVTCDDPDMNLITDISTEGDQPDPDADGDPSNNTDVSVIDLNSNPVIGIAKTATIDDNEVTFDFYLENLGDVTLGDIGFSDYLGARFGSGNFAVVSGPTLIDDPGTITVNAGYDGQEDVELLDSANSSLVAGDTAQIRIVVQVGLVVDQQSLGTGNYSNQVVVTATYNTTTFTDTSDDNTDPDSDGDGNPNESGENDATLFTLSPTALVGIAKTASVSNFTATIDLYLENFGAGTATISVIDNLDDVFGSGNYTVLGPATLIDDPGTITINAAYDGSGENDLVTPASTLAAGDTAQLQFQVLITTESDQGGGYGIYSNNADVYATQPSGLIFADTSDDGTDPDPNGNGDPRNGGEDNPTAIALEGSPVIGIAKRAQVSGTLVTLDFTIENLGDVTLTGITFSDDLDAVFGAGNYAISSSPASVSGPGTLSLSGGFTGSGGSTAVVTSGQLRPGETQVVRFVVNITNVTDQGSGLGVYANSVTVSAQGPDETPTSDISDSGIEPDASGNGNPGDANEDDPTPIVIGDEAIIGAAKAATVADLHVTFDYVVENFGASTLANLSVSEDLDAVFGAGNYTLSGPAVLTADPGTVTLNGSFDGSADTEFLNPASTLASGASVGFQLELDITAIVDQGLGLGHFSNQVTATATAPLGTVGTDLSDDGTDPDPNGNSLPNDSNEDDPTTFAVTADVLGLAKTASVSGGQVTFDVYLENLGSDDITSVSAIDDLDAVFGVGTYHMVTAPFLVGDPRDVVPNSAFNGASDTQLVDSGALNEGETAQIRFVVYVDQLSDQGGGLGVYSNQVSGDGDGFMDLSDSGTDADPSGNGDPSDVNEDDPTPFTVAEAPVLGLAHAAAVNGSLVTLDYYLENLGNVDLANVALVSNLDTVFGSGWAIETAPTLVDNPGTLTLNAAYDGSSDTGLISSGSLAYGETAQIRLVVRVSILTDQGSGLGVYSSQPQASADGPSTSTSDLSDNGTNPDPDDDGNPDEAGENDATPITVAQNPVIALIKNVEVGENILAIQIVAVNIGNVDLTSISVTDDLDAVFGIGTYELSPVLVGGLPGSPAENPNYNGGDDPELLDGSGSLAPGEGVIIYFEVLLYNNLPYGQYQNQASATASGPMGNTSDLSDDSLEIDPDEDGNPNETGENDPNVFDFTSRPVIGLAKTEEHTGRQITFHFYVENLGETPLYDVYVYDVLEDTFGLDTYTIIQGPTYASGVNKLIFNGDYNGESEGEEALVVGGDLDPGEVEHFTLVVEVDPFSHDDSPDEGHYFNSAEADAYGEFGYTFDTSDWGTDPDPDGDGNPSESGEDDATELYLLAQPRIGAAKIAAVNGTQVTFEVRFDNLGDVDFTSVQLPDDLDSVFGAGNYSVTSAPQVLEGTAMVATNGAFDGSADPNLIDPASMQQGEYAVIAYTVNVTNVTDRGLGLGVYSNQITITADGDGGTHASDLSDAAALPDSDGDGRANSAGEDDPTLFIVGQTTTIGAAKDAIVNGTVVTFSFVVQNLGDVALTSIALPDNLDDVFGAGNYLIESAPSFVLDPGTLTLNAGFNGSSDTQLISSGGLGIGTLAQFEVQVRVLALTDQGLGTGNYSNQVYATGTSAQGQVAYDLSDAGSDPDNSGNGLPNDAGENDPTEFTVAEVSALGVAKSVLILGTRTLNINNGGVNGSATGQHVRFVFTLENLGNTTLTNLSLPDDLVPVFGSGNFGKINSAGFPEVRLNPGTVSTNSSYNGSTDTEMLNPASSLAPGAQAEIVCEFLVVNIVDVGNGIGVYSNQVSFEGDDGSGTLSDLSDDGLIPDPDGNGYAGDEGEDDPTVFSLGSYLGAAKTVSIAGNQVTFNIYLENFGAGNYGDLSLVDDLGNVFGDENYSVDSVSLIDDPGTLILNPSFDGSSDAEMLGPTSSLVAGDTAQIELVVTVLKLKNRGAGLGVYSNQVTIAGAQSGGYVITDLSDNGTDPDPDGDGNPNESGENDTTGFNMATDAIVGAALSASASDGAVTLLLNLEAFGTVSSSQISLDASLDLVFGAGNYTLLSATLVDDPGTLTLDPAYDGSANLALIGAGSTLANGDTAGIELQVQVDNIVDTGFGTGRYSMQVTVNTVDSRGIVICDLSDNGTNPDPNSNNDPTTVEEDDATLFNFNGAALGLARRATVQGTQIIFDLFIENLGGTSLPSFSITESLLTVFGFGNFSMAAAPTLIVNPGTVLLNNSYDGLFSPSLVVAGSSLAPGTRAQVRYIVNVTNVTNQGNGFGVYITQSTISTTDSDGNALSDLSDNGVLSDPNGNGVANETGENDTTLAIIGEQPILGAAKEVALNGNELTIGLYLENLGNVSLSQVSLTENLDEVLGAGNYTITTPPFFTDDPGTLTLNGSYDGGADSELFSAGTLASGDTAVVELVVDVDHVANGGHYSNQVVAAAEGPSATYYADFSDDGNEPDANSDGEPGDAGEDDPSTFTLSSLSAGVAKQATVLGDQVTFDYTIENLGTQAVTGVSVVEDLDAVFGAGNYSIVSGPTLISAPRALDGNPSFDGSSDLELVAGDIATGVEQIRLVVQIDTLADVGSGYGVYSNQVVLTADDGVYDLSDNGTDPDANGNGAADDAGEDDPTPVVIAQRTEIGVAKTAAVSGAQVTFDIYLENLGNVTLANVAVAEDLDALLGTDHYAITSAPTLTDDPATLTLNASFDGSASTALLSAGSLAPGETATIRFAVDLALVIDSGSGMGLYSNQVTASGEGPGMVIATDLSDDGTNPDPNGNDVADDSGEDDPTLFTVQAATIGDFVWNDLDGDGVQDGGEPGLAGFAVYADFNNNGVQDGIEPSDTSDGSGAYAVVGLIAGTYNMRVDAATVTAGFVRTSAADPIAITVTSGATDNTADFGYQQQDASIGDFVWDDLDGDGVQDGGEPGISGVTVFFDLNTNGSLDGGEPSTTTDGSGAYSFDSLPTGTYTVAVDTATVTTGYVQTGGTNPVVVNLAAGETYTTADFGYQEQDASIGDFVWNDLDGDGMQDGGEPGIAGVTVFFDLNTNGSLDGGEPITTTDGSGAYSFDNLPTGTYTVAVDTATVTTGFVLTGGTNPHVVNLAAGELYITADFGYQQQDASIGDFVWNDLDGDGVQDGGEPGLAGIVVFFDLNSNGSLDGGEPSTTTDGSGAYSFDNLPTGTYTVAVDTTTVTTGFVLTGGTNPHVVNLAAGELYTDADFGYQQQDASIGDFVWNDLDGDGVQDGGEPGLSGVVAFLDLNTNGSLDGGEPSDTTDGAGAYSIDNLPLGTYSVAVQASSVPAGFVLTGGTNPVSVTIAAGEVYTTADFGYQEQDATIGDFVWNDLDGDGVQDGGEPGLNGIVVYLDLNTSGSRDGGEPFATTNASGAYDITNLATGSYSVAIDASTLPTAAVLTGGTDPLVVNLAAGEDYNNADFGYQVQNASIGDLVWNDLDGDGVYDAGEPGLAGVTIFLDLNGDTHPSVGEPTATTDGAGAYDIQSLAAGTYTVRADTSTVPSGYHLTTHIPPLVVTLAVSEDYNDADFGYIQSDGRIGDLIWNDLDGDGVQDPGEPGLASVTVYADLNANQTQDADEPAATSDANGAYALRNLAAGTYTVIVATPPVGYTLTTGNQPLSVTLTAGENHTDADFGFQRSNGTIGDLVWSDRNGNGTRDVGEPGLGGVTLQLSLDSNGDGSRNADEPVLAVTITTNGVGFYQFTGLTAGDYLVEVTDTGGVVADYHLTGGVNPLPVTLTAGQIYTGADFGYQRADGTIGDQVFEDLDNDGMYDVGEPGIPGVVLYLYEDLDRDGQVDAGEPLRDTQVTDGTGTYFFEGLEIGFYVVDVADGGVLNGYQLTFGTDPRGVNLAKGQSFAVADFGYCRPPEILEQPQDQLACVGEDVTVSIDVDAGLEPQIQWRKDGQIIPGATEPEYTIVNAQTTHTGDYDCVITTGCGSVTSAPAHVQVDAIRAAFHPNVVVQGVNPVTLTVIMECGTDPYVYEWKNLTANQSLGAGNPLTLPTVLQVTTLIRAYVKDHANLLANAEVTVQVLTALDPAFFDLDGDGCNLLEDVQWLAPEWQEHTLDANEDGLTNVLDFLYIRVDPSCE